MLGRLRRQRRSNRLLRPRRERPRCRAAKRDKQFSPPDVDCHVTLPWGSCNGWDHITPSRAALRDTPVSDRRADIRNRQLRAKSGREQPQQTAALFDHLVGENVELRRNHQPKGVGGLAIDHQVEPRGLLDWKVTRFSALENFVNE
jgi:hypothetical protein